MSLSNWISKHAAFTPQKPALIYEAGEISYAELHQRIEACALELRERFRIQEGDRVAFLGLNSPQFLVLLFACARLKAIFLPLNWRLAAPEHQYILEDAAPKLCICEQEFDAHVLSLKNAVPDCHFIAADFDNPNWERMQFQPILNQPALEANEEGSDQTPLLLVYTSGTTGRPKGAVLTQGAIQWNALNSLHMHGLTSQDIILTVLPMFHVGGLNIQTTPALYCGATVILHRRFDPAATLAAFQNQKPTLTVLVPATISALLAHPLGRHPIRPI